MTSEAEEDRKCRFCGDLFSDPERDCPYPAPGKPYVDCGRGGHVFDIPALTTVEQCEKHHVQNCHFCPKVECGDNTATPYQAARTAFNEYAGMDAPNLPADRDSALQVRLARWQANQFGAVPSYQPVLGMSEELGELAEAVLALMAAQGRVSHATLKAEQRIRGFEDRDKVREFIADAIADYDIFADQLCTAMRLDRGTLKRATAENVLKRDWRKHKKDGGQP